MWTEKVLSRKEVLGVFVVISFVYVLPIIRADYAYIDDSWRSLLLADNGWRTQGRVLLEVLNKFLAFNNAAINIFPMPLLIATFAMALALSRLTFWYFPQPGLAACLVVFPLLCNPFFLGNITYQYDGPGMMLAVVTAIYAVTCDLKNVFLRGLSSALLVLVMLSLYQLTVTVFIGLCFIDFVWSIKNRKPAREIISTAVQRGLQLVTGGFIYYLTAYQMIDSARGELVLFNQPWFEGASEKFMFSMDKILQLINAGNFLFFIAILLVAGVGFGLLMKNISVLDGGRLEKITVLVICLCTIPVLIVGVPGARLFLAESFVDARNLLGFSVVLVFLFLLNHEYLGRLWPGLRLLLIIPVLWMFSFCYAYGQIIIAKKELETAMGTFVAYDLVVTPELKNVGAFYYVVPESGGNWLPRGHGAMTYMPVLRYILSDASTLLHPYFLTRLGINNVVDGSREAFEAAMSVSKNPIPVLDRKFYSIYITDAGNFIVMKEIVDSEEYMGRP